ncbi:hypothetical protein [Acaryochloris marina]|uniref:hypothetical protein n=1 Tax=Acaryochloris marina TaxID=155978 RepID=UPI001BAEF6AB|nr:hypothetical protein [Acaryochloris marina]
MMMPSQISAILGHEKPMNLWINKVEKQTTTGDAQKKGAANIAIDLQKSIRGFSDTTSSLNIVTSS